MKLTDGEVCIFVLSEDLFWVQILIPQKLKQTNVAKMNWVEVQQQQGPVTAKQLEQW